METGARKLENGGLGERGGFRYEASEEAISEAGKFGGGKRTGPGAQRSLQKVALRGRSRPRQSEVGEERSPAREDSPPKKPNHSRDAAAETN